MSNLPIKTVTPINLHLLCGHCGKLYSNPVINVHCGHTFCKECALSNIKGSDQTQCPIDSVICSTSSLVLNRAIISQIEDLDIYCQYGLVWSEKENDHIVKVDGCTQTIKLAKRKLHEDSCEYMPVSCPNNKEKCGIFPKRNLEEHLVSCPFHPCPHQEKGCEFLATSGEVEKHVVICGYRSLQVVPGNLMQLRHLERQNEILEAEVKGLKEKVYTLESTEASLQSQLDQCIKRLHVVEEQYRQVEKTIESLGKQLKTIPETRPRLSSSNRSPSQTAISNVSSPRAESWTMPFQFKCIGTLRSHTDVLWCLRTKGNMLYSCGDDKTIKMWNLEALEKGCRHTIQAHDDQIHTMAVGEDYLYSGGGDRVLKAWNPSDGSLVKAVEDAHNNIIAAMVCTENYLFTSSHTVIKVWDAKTLDTVHKIQGLHHWVRSLTLNYTKDKLYSGSHNTIEIWETVGNFKLKGKITHDYGSIYCFAITKKYLIAGTYNKNIHVFDVETNTYIQKLSGHVGVIFSMTASPSGRFLFTASSDKTIQIWNLEKMLPIHTLSRHEGSVNTLVLYNDLLLSGSEDTEIKVFKYSKMQPGFGPS